MKIATAAILVTSLLMVPCASMVQAQVTLVPSNEIDMSSTGPTFEPVNGEQSISEGNSYDEALDKFHTKIASIGHRENWDFQIFDLTVSESADYPLIVRGKVDWLIDDCPAKTQEIVWRDRQGKWGASSRFIGE